MAENAKLKSDAAYGKTLTNQEKHNDLLFCNEENAAKHVNDLRFHALSRLGEDAYEVEKFKSTIALDLPVQIGCFFYGYAELRMLRFYHQVLDPFVDRSDFELVQMDTDSLYMALSKDSLEVVFRDDKKAEFESVRPSRSCSIPKCTGSNTWASTSGNPVCSRSNGQARPWWGCVPRPNWGIRRRLIGKNAKTSCNEPCSTKLWNTKTTNSMTSSIFTIRTRRSSNHPLFPECLNP